MIRSRRLSLGSDRVDGSGDALCLTALRGAYRRVAQSRICTTVLLLAQKGAWGVRPLRASQRITSDYLKVMVAQTVCFFQISAQKTA
jgi:hypothetical protein